MKDLDIRVNKKYRLQHRLGKGSFGAVYKVDLDNDQAVAIKLESIKIDPSILSDEADLYKQVAGGLGIPNVYWFGQECEFRAMVFDLLGPSLEDLFNFCSRVFSLKTVLLLADQLISRIQYLHSKRIIHRDIKAENFLMGIGKYGNRVYVTDLGLSTEYRVAEADTDTARQWGASLIGTAHFASINAHSGVEQSCRDDMESLGYLLVYFTHGSLPWEGLKAKNSKLKYQLILEKKKATTIDQLCDGLPEEFASYFRHVRSVRFADKPNYVYLRKIFRTLFIRKGFEYDNVFDWTILKFLMASDTSLSAQQPAQEGTTAP